MSPIRRWIFKFLLIAFIPVIISACSTEVTLTNSQIPQVPHSDYPVVVTEEIKQLPESKPFSLEDFAAETVSGTSVISDDLHTEKLIKFVASRFNKPVWLITKIVYSAQKYAKTDFPKTEDILAIIAVESTFNINAHHRGSWGLMQVEAKSNGNRSKGQSLTDIDNNIRVGTEILSEYYSVTHSQSGAIVAYNVGIGKYLAGIRSDSYSRKIRKERAMLARV